MISSPDIFFQSFQKDFHRIKAIYLIRMLEENEKFETIFYEETLDEDEKFNFKLALKSDLRQTYFHAIETFFELFFGLNPRGKKPNSDRDLIFTLTYSNFSETYKKIRDIAENENSLDFLDEEINFLNHKVTIGQYLFYMGFVKDNMDANLRKRIDESIEAIKSCVRILAKDFTTREEYNAYKHGLRIMPTTTNLAFADAETGEVKFVWDLSDSMSFYTKMKDREELRMVTKLFDTERDYKMTILCSDFIHYMVFFRRVSMRLKGDEGKFDKVEVGFTSQEVVNEASKINVEVQNLIYTVTKVAGSR